MTVALFNFLLFFIRLLILIFNILVIALPAALRRIMCEMGQTNLSARHLNFWSSHCCEKGTDGERRCVWKTFRMKLISFLQMHTEEMKSYWIQNIFLGWGKQINKQALKKNTNLSWEVGNLSFSKRIVRLGPKEYSGSSPSIGKSQVCHA